jgi:3-hexulose-6-phosphate synthase
LPEAIKAKPDLVIVGGGIANQADKKAAAAEIRKLINQAG